MEDEGDGFAPEQLRDPTDIGLLKELIDNEQESIYTHGRGVFLIKKIADMVQYNQKGNKVHVIKYRKAVKTRFIFSE